MSNVYLDPNFSDETRRQHLFQGDLLLFSARPSTRAFIAFARELIEQAFAPRNPQLAQFEMPVAEFAAVLTELKPRFIHHPRSKELLQGILTEFGCDLSKTFFDVPKMRSMASGEYLKGGIAKAFDLHRDSWFASPLCQQHWWIPIFEIGPDDVMSFHPRHLREAVANSPS